MTAHVKTPLAFGRLVLTSALAAAALTASFEIRAQGLPARVEALEQAVAALQHTVSALQNTVIGLQSQITALGNATTNVRALNPYLAVNPADAQFATARLTAINLQIVNGSPGGPGLESTGHANGLGNLIIGYNAPRAVFGGSDDRTGSHYLVIGDRQNYGNGFLSSAGLLVGVANTISADYASV